MLNPFVRFVGKTFALWVTLLVGSMVGATILGLGDQSATDDGPLGAGAAFLVVNALHAIVLSAIAARAVVSGWKVGVLVGATLYVAQSFLLVIEALYFAESVSAPVRGLIGSNVLTLINAVSVGIAAALMWKRPRFEVGGEIKLGKLVPSIAGVALLYVISYFTAGYFIAWAVPDVRTYYGEGLEIDLLPLAAFQVFRGAIWALLALAIVRNIKAGTVLSAGLVGSAFSVLAAAQLLYPNSFMPWAVRFPHLVEIAISNFLFGAIAAIILRQRH